MLSAVVYYSHVGESYCLGSKKKATQMQMMAVSFLASVNTFIRRITWLNNIMPWQCCEKKSAKRPWISLATDFVISNLSVKVPGLFISVLSWIINLFISLKFPISSLGFSWLCCWVLALLLVSLGAHSSSLILSLVFCIKSALSPCSFACFSSHVAPCVSRTLSVSLALGLS